MARNGCSELLQRTARMRPLAMTVLTSWLLAGSVIAGLSAHSSGGAVLLAATTTTPQTAYDDSANLALQATANRGGADALVRPVVDALGPSIVSSGWLVAPRPIAGISDDVLRNLPASQQRAVRSLQQQLVEHQAKLGAYRANPYAYDNLGILRDAPTDAIRQSIIDGRIRHLQHEINTFADQIRKLTGG